MCLLRLAVLLAACSQVALAQTPAPSRIVTLTLDQAIQIAKDNSPTYLGTATQMRSADAQVRSAYGALLPSSRASFNAQYYEQGTQVFNGLSFASPAAEASSYFVGLNYAINGQTLLGPRFARANRRATEASISNAAEQLRSTVSQSYINVLSQQATAALDDSLTLSAQAQLDLIKAKQAVGAATLLDVQQQEVVVGQDQVTALTAHNAAVLALYQLYQYMGVPKPDSVILTTEFAVAQPTFKLDSLIDLAKRTNPQINALRQTEKAYTVNVKMYQSAYTPTLSLSTGLGGQAYQYADQNLLVNNAAAQQAAGFASCMEADSLRTAVGLTSASCPSPILSPARINQLHAANNVFPFHFQTAPINFGATLSLPIFDNFNRELNIQQAIANRENASYNVKAQELATATLVTQAYLLLMNAYKTIALQQQNAQYALQNLGFAEEKYRVGSATYVDLTTARVASDQAQINRVNAIYSYHQAFAQLEGAVGRPLR